MDKVKVEIKNCYGINSLEKEFDFTGGKSTQIIYAPNGVMKTSFANVFDDYSKSAESKDLMYPQKESIRSIKDGNGNDITPESIFVIRHYEKNFKSNKISTLLVNDELRKQYEKIHENINIEKEKLIEVLLPLTGLKKGIEEEFCHSFNDDTNNFLQLLSSIEDKIINNSASQYSNIIYNNIFNEKVVAFLETGDFKNQIKEYIEKYDELISNSPILHREFNHYHATTVQKSLADNGFFKAQHSINLNINGKKQEITDQKEFLKLIKSAKEAILNDKSLLTIFNNIDKKISNAQLRDFREYLFENQNILTELVDLNSFKRKLWISYLKDNKEEYTNLVEEYKKGQNKIKAIIEKAKNEQTDWENVIGIFNRRFFVPYRLAIRNKEDSILKDQAPSIDYYFDERPENVEEELLLRVLSQGESRTLYLLNIIFEIESRKKQGIKTLFIIDDIADSFDYKNKYAIIEYLKDVSEQNNFFSIILTHNFDFFRTVQERISGKSKYMGSYMAMKENDCIKLENLKYRYISNPLKNWKSDLSDNTKLIASVTFARNIAEYIGDNENFNKLTSVLHMKESTETLTIKDLQETYRCVFKDLNDLVLENGDKKLYDIIFEVANQIVSSDSESVANLENKVVLSIAIRLNAEKHMINQINSPEFVSSINKNQTGVLFGKFKELFPEKINSIEILEKVNIMTPENIHLNSFMFEPILDMSDLHLKQLYNEVLQLLSAGEELQYAKAYAAATRFNK
ncbi:hypothetical protein ACFO4N_17960 [Camelliibacillus cellulosilyticus]|uniref:Uncharacterized protein n=1 Tax=Camelliibacillus cellulosilyticus TaxID=2174486 RepID=A0ABV9GQS2_9BACL